MWPADTFRQIDVLALPTAPTVYTCEQVLADPIRLNARLGTYTNFVNLLDLCGLAVPAALHADHTPFGVTFLAPAGNDAVVASIARQFHADTGCRQVRPVPDTRRKRLRHCNLSLSPPIAPVANNLDCVPVI